MALRHYFYMKALKFSKWKDLLHRKENTITGRVNEVADKDLKKEQRNSL